MPQTLMELEKEDPVLGASRCTRDELWAYLAEKVQKNLNTDRGADELLREEPLGDGETACKYELRFKTIKVSESGLVGKCSSLEMRACIDTLFQFDMQKALEIEQPQMQWVVVAGRVTRLNLRKSAFTEKSRKGFADGDVDAAIMLGMMMQKQGNLAPPGREHAQVPEYKAVLEVAFAGIGGSLIDPWVVRTQQPDMSPHQAYLRTRSLRHLPNAQRKERKLASDLIRAFYGQTVEANLAPEAAEPKARLTQEQLNSGIRLREMGWSWTDIGNTLGVSHQFARSALEKFAQKTKDEGEES